MTIEPELPGLMSAVVVKPKGSALDEITPVVITIDLTAFEISGNPATITHEPR